MGPFGQTCEVWSQQQGQWRHVETIPCGLFPKDSPGMMFFPALCPKRGDRIKDPGTGGATTWEVTDIMAQSEDRVRVTVRRVPPEVKN